MTHDDATSGMAAPTTDIPFPYDVEEAHPLDSHEKDTIITKSSRNGFRVEFPLKESTSPSSSDGNPIAPGDVLEHLPVGSKIVIGDEGDTKVGAAIPATDDRPQVSAFGKNIYTAMRVLWPWLVDGGFAVLSADAQSEAQSDAATHAETPE